MKVALIASIGLAALSILAPSANAQQTTTTVSLTQTLQPVTRSYPGVAADILGIQTGMTVSQAEAIAEKNYPGKPKEEKAQVSFTYRGVTAQSQLFVQRVDFRNQTADMSDTLSLYFGSPVTGNTLYAMDRKLDYNTATALNHPLASTIKADLIKKYGPISFQIGDGNSEMIWAFTQKAHAVCKDQNCVGIGGVVDPGSYDDLSSYSGNKDDFNGVCSSVNGSSDIFSIDAYTSGNAQDQTKSDGVRVIMRDAATCLDDYTETFKQLKAAAIKFYNAASKAPAAPKL